MPTYEFRCPDGTVVERMFKMSEVPDSIPCPHCEGEATRVISGGAGLLFKGTGFYITDYGKDGKKDQRAAASGADAKGGDAKADSKAEAKPASEAKPSGSPAPSSGSSSPSSTPKPD